eukprot:RCo041759
MPSSSSINGLTFTANFTPTVTFSSCTGSFSWISIYSCSFPAGLVLNFLSSVSSLMFSSNTICDNVSSTGTISGGSVYDNSVSFSSSALQAMFPSLPSSSFNSNAFNAQLCCNFDNLTCTSGASIWVPYSSDCASSSCSSTDCCTAPTCTLPSPLPPE